MNKNVRVRRERMVEIVWAGRKRVGLRGTEVGDCLIAHLKLGVMCPCPEFWPTGRKENRAKDWWGMWGRDVQKRKGSSGGLISHLIFGG